MTAAIESARFHTRHAWFNLKEQFSDIPSGLATNALIPFFVWLLAQVWERFNAHQANFTLKEVIVYIGITELLYMTFVRPASISRASGDFSISLSRPRSWLATSFSGLVGRSLGGRVFLSFILGRNETVQNCVFHTLPEKLVTLFFICRDALTMSGNLPPTPLQKSLMPAPVPVDSTITLLPGLARY